MGTFACPPTSCTGNRAHFKRSVYRSPTALRFQARGALAQLPHRPRPARGFLDVLACSRRHLTCQSTRTNNSRRRLRRKVLLSGHFHVRQQGTTVHRLRAVMNWALPRRRQVLVVIAVIGAYLAWFASTIVPTPRSELRQQTVLVSYVGEVVGADRSDPFSADARRRSGFGIGISPSGVKAAESNAQLQRLMTRYYFFDADLEVTREDLARGIKPGFTYTIQTRKSQIVAIRDEHREILSYDEYVARVGARRNLFLALAIAVSIVGALFWGAATVIIRRSAIAV